MGWTCPSRTPCRGIILAVCRRSRNAVNQGLGSPTDLLYQLKLRTAHLVSQPDLASRKLVLRQVGQLYKTRSKIVHTGKFDVTASELKLIDEYARIALFVVLGREPFPSKP